MGKIVTIDVGGTGIKYGLWDEIDQRLSSHGQIKTPDNLEDFYQSLEQIVSIFESEPIEGVGLSIPGAVNQKTGIIGGISALPYIHNFPIQQQIEARLDLSITMENDANCAALAEMTIGAARDLKNVMFLIIGTGVGGAVVVDRKIIHGNHLIGGEFGMLLGDNNIRLSMLGTAVHLAERYNLENGTDLTGREVLELAEQGDVSALKQTGEMYRNLAKSIYNLQFVIDPEVFIIGGGVSSNEKFVNHLRATIHKLVTEIDGMKVEPKILAAKYHNDANLIGAAYNYYRGS